MARSLVEVSLPNGGTAALVVPWKDLTHEPWQERLLRFAELVGPDATWTATPLDDDTTDKAALTGH